MCGLFAFISDKETGTQKFSWDKFNHLGLDNDERGGDSIGRVVGDQVDRFVSKKLKTTYQDYVINHRNGEPSHIALGHTRKASVGIVSEETAQPIVLPLPDGGGSFTMVHNGTLFNWEELADKYGIAKAGKSDSMVLAEIIMTFGYGVLLEYQGCAALIIKDDRDPNTLKVFKGESKSYNRLEEERPLYFWQESDTSLYISSRQEGLYFIGGDTDTVADFETNTLYTLRAGEVINTEVYDRTECSSTKVWAKVETKPTTYGTHRYDNGYSMYENYEDETYAAYEHAYGRAVVPVVTTTPVFNIRKEVIINPYNADQIVHARLRYWFFLKKDQPVYANGPVNLSESGLRNAGDKRIGDKTYYFYCGIMLNDEAAYRAVKLRFGKSKTWVDNESNIMEVSEHSVYPVCTLFATVPSYENARKWNPNATANSQKAPYFTGTINPIFSTRTYVFDLGSLERINFKAFSNLPDHPKETKVVPMVPATIEVPSAIIVQDINDVFYNEDEDVDVDGNFVDTTIDEILEKAISEGMSAVMLAIDAFKSDLEVSGINNKKLINTVTNLSKIEDILYDVDRFKSRSLITDYDQF